LGTVSYFLSAYRDDQKDISRMRNNWRFSEVKKLRPRGPEAPNSSHEFGELIAVVRLRGGSRVTGGLSARGMANVLVGDSTFTVGNHRYLLPGSCHLGLPNFIRLMTRSTRSILILKIQASCSVQCWNLQEAPALQLIRLTSEHLWRFALLYGIQTFMNLFAVD
jgi:hypothetical protein